MERYSYKPLSSDISIRILELQPGKSEDPLRAELVEAELTAERWNPIYGALSYCWGTSNFDMDLECDGKNIRITKSLDGALRRIREEEKIKLLWVDQVCINQEDIPERNSQVKLMGWIYRHAVRVIIWLGEEDDKLLPSRRVGRLERWQRWLDKKNQNDVADARLQNLIERLEKAQLKRWENGDTRDRHQLQWKGLEDYGLPDMNDVGYPAFFRLFQRQYFSRGWILQEVALGGEHSVQFGTAKVSLTQFYRAICVCCSLGFSESDDLRMDDANRFAAIITMLYTRHENKSMDLLKLLLENRDAVTTDPRDKIYCLLGLASDKELLSIEPRYEESVENVYRDFTLRHIQAYNNLDVLTIPRSEKNVAFPSWVNDWRLRDTKHITSLDGRDTNQVCQYCATKETLANLTTSSNPNIIGLSGYIIDTIVECGLKHHTEDFDPNWTTRQHILHAFRTGVYMRLKYTDWKCVALLHTWKPYITGESREEVFRRCMTAGRAFDSDTNFDAIKNNYRSWTRYLSLYPVLGWLLPKFALRGFFWSLVILRACRTSFALWWWVPFYSRNEQNEAFTNLCMGSNGRVIVRTKKGYVGLAPETTKKGDSVVLMKGGKLPFIMREDAKNWVVVGDCYIHGIMNGEAFDEQKCETMWIR